MPELAEVEIVRRNVERWWDRRADRVLVHDEAIVREGPIDLLQELLSSPPPVLSRRGKHLIATFDAGTVVFHFRMTGKLVLEPEPEPRFARLAWSGAAGWLVFRDARRLGHVTVLEPGGIERYAPISTMGPEPFDMTPQTLAVRLSSRRRLKSALLDQSVIAGVGNIAVSELFWRLRLAPAVRCDELDARQIRDLAEALPAYFQELIELQAADEVVYLGEGKAENPFDVYAREGEPCPRCVASIERVVVGGRSSYYCPSCQ